MTIQEKIDHLKKQGVFNDYVLFAPVGNNTDEAIPCEPCEADACGCVIVDIYYTEKRQAIIYADYVA